MFGSTAGSRSAPLLTAVCLWIALCPSARAEGTAAGVRIENSATLDYRNASGVAQPTIRSNTAVVLVSQVAAVVVEPASGSGRGSPGAVAYYAVTVINRGNGADTFRLTAASLTSAAWPAAIYADDGAGGGIASDGVHQAGETNLASSTGSLAAEASFHCFVAVFVPATAEAGMGDTTRFTASSEFDGSKRASASFSTTVDAASLRGQVRDAATGEPLAGATVSVYLDNTWVDTTLSEAPEGLFSFGPELAPGTYTVSATKEGYARQTMWDITIPASPTPFLEFNLDLSGRLVGQVTDALTGAPLAGAEITVYKYKIAWARTLTQWPSGDYEISQDLHGGECLVRVRRSGYVRQYKVALVTPGETTRLDFALNVSGQLTGYVIDALTGAPVIGARVSAYRDDEEWGRAFATAPLGGYLIDKNLATGTYTVVATCDGYQETVIPGVAVTAGESAVLHLVMRPQ